MHAAAVELVFASCLPLLCSFLFRMLTDHVLAAQHCTAQVQTSQFGSCVDGSVCRVLTLGACCVQRPCNRNSCTFLTLCLSGQHFSALTPVGQGRHDLHFVGSLVKQVMA